MSEYDEFKQDVRDLRKELNETKEDVNTIKLHVTNHIPHVLTEIKDKVVGLDTRLQCFEKKATKMQGISEFLTLIVKGAIILATLIWTGLQIYSKVHDLGVL